MSNLSVVRKLGIAMDYLENGGELKLGDFTYVLDGDDNFHIKAMSYEKDTFNWDSGDSVYFQANDLTVKYLMNELDKLSESEIMSMSASNALHKMNKKR
jgi:hypothetical protein